MAKRSTTLRSAMSIIAEECLVGLHVYGVGHEAGNVIPSMAEEKAVWLNRLSAASETMAELIAIVDDPDFEFPAVRRTSYRKTDEYKHAMVRFEERKALATQE